MNKVLEILLNHQGKERAIRGKELARQLGFRDDRLVRQTIRDLIAKGYPIASSTQEPFGYYLVINLAEAKAYQEGLKGRIIEDALRLRDFKRSAGFTLKKVMQGRLI